ncbi:MAG: protein translocase subunit SecD [Planctomycetaceae bacterium]|nr:protein translocase subunit SecD [Planctomycetaceae bacterium]
MESVASPYVVPLALIIIAILAVFLGTYVRKTMRMPETGWKVSLIVSVIGIAALILFTSWPPKQGIDLKGGIILIYEVDQEKTRQNATKQRSDENEDDRQSVANDTVDMDALIQALSRRINPGGVQEIVVRKYGDNQVEIIIPDVTQEEAKQVQKLITTGGFLKFMIVADQDRHSRLCRLADAPSQAGQYEVLDENGVVIGQWAKLSIDPTKPVEEGEEPVYRIDPPNGKTRVVRGQKEVLMIVERTPALEGKHLAGVRSGYNDMNPCVYFDMTGTGSNLMGNLTAKYSPDENTNSFSLLGIVMDGELISAPRINEKISGSGIIEGSFTKDEVDLLVNVLRAGRLPAVLRSEPLSQNEISPLLGADTIEQGKRAIGVSLVSVLVFMIFYYHFAGVVSCLALLLNLALVLALMIFVGAAFSLPGMAGLVLTVGMSVDANVLIFERIREELRNGAALRMAIRNGFGRATRTIVDANVTTLITAFVLYAIGSEQLRAFAVTLICGILMCLFTAIFCSRVVFDIAERNRWIKKLTMLQILATPNWDLMGKRHLAALGSIIVILTGLAGVAARGPQIFDIDFLGGTSVQVQLETPQEIGEMRKLVNGLRDKGVVETVTVTEVKSEKLPPGSIYRIDTSLPAAAEAPTPTDSDSKDETQTTIVTIQNALIGQLRDDQGVSILKMHNFSYTPPMKPTPESSQAPDSDTPGNSASQNSTGTDESTTAAADTTATEKSDQDDSQSNSTDSSDVNSEVTEKEWNQLGSESTLTFDEDINAETITMIIRETAKDLGVREPGIVLTNPAWDGQSSQGYTTWTLKLSCGIEDAERILSALKTRMNSTPVWLAANQIGSTVAGDKTRMAIAAVIASLLGIIAYIWIRFQRVVYGLAAVVALIHDVLVTLGAIALSLWLSKVFGFLLIDEFKISLPVVAAFLTIIGYSLNDTIVVFDRIRESRGKSQYLTAEMINTSINQTLSRTVLTSLTTLIAVLILYVIGGQGIHAFAYALLVGVIVGTYSSIFVASPMLLWMSGSEKPAGKKQKQKVTA